MPLHTLLHARQSEVAVQVAERLRREPLTVLVQSGAAGRALDLDGALLPLLRRRAGDGPGPRRERQPVVVPIPDRRAAGRREIVAVCSRWDALAGPLAALRQAVLDALPWSDRDELETAEPLAEQLLRWQRRHEARLLIVLDRCDALWREPPTPAAARLLAAIDAALAHPGLRCHWLIVLHDPVRLATLARSLGGLTANSVRRSDTGGELVDAGGEGTLPADAAVPPPDERTLPSALGAAWPAAWRTDAAPAGATPPHPASGTAAPETLGRPPAAPWAGTASIDPAPARRPSLAGRALLVIVLLVLAVVAWRTLVLEFGFLEPRASRDPLLMAEPPAAGQGHAAGGPRGVQGPPGVAAMGSASPASPGPAGSKAPAPGPMLELAAGDDDPGALALVRELAWALAGPGGLVASVQRPGTPVTAVADASGGPPTAAAPRYAVLRHDALQAARRAGGLPLAVLTPLFVEEVHLLVRADSPLRHWHELPGQRLNVGPADGAAALSAAALYEALFEMPLPVERTRFLAPDAALQALLAGEIDAMLRIGPQPDGWLAALTPGTARQLRLLAVDRDRAESRRAARRYLPVTLAAGRYSTQPDGPVATFGVLSYLVATGPSARAAFAGAMASAPRAASVPPAASAASVSLPASAMPAASVSLPASASSAASVSLPASAMPPPPTVPTEGTSAAPTAPVERAGAAAPPVAVDSAEHAAPSGSAPPALPVLPRSIGESAVSTSPTRVALAFCAALPELVRHGHPAWRQVSPGLPIPAGWPDIPAAAAVWRDCAAGRAAPAPSPEEGRPR